MTVSALPDNVGVLPVSAFTVPPLAVHDRRVHVGRGKGVGLIQQRDHTQQNGPARKRAADIQCFTVHH